MLFQLYGDKALYQLLGWLMVFLGLVLTNEIARRTKKGGIFFFLVLPGALTVYFIAIAIGAANGAAWAVNNPTHLYMNSWFHYAKLYAATIGCIGFMMLKYQWGIGKKEWFKPFPFVIVAINILIAVGSDFESAIKGALSADGWWLSSENVWLYGGWWNWLNGFAGLLNIFCMTGWWGIYSSKKKDDMLWPDMIWLYILAYDVWNFQYTYLNLPTHAWYCGLAPVLFADAPLILDHHKADAANGCGIELGIVEPAVHVEVGGVVQSPTRAHGSADGYGDEVHSQCAGKCKEEENAAFLGAPGDLVGEDQSQEHQQPAQKLAARFVPVDLE